MPRLLQPLWLWLAAATDTELQRMVEYLKAENRILRDKLPDRLTVTARERNRLVQLGAKLGPAIKDLVTIVCPRTFARWVARATPSDPATPPGNPARSDTPTRKPGRPRTADDIWALILRLARENGWGYTRILGELKKLGITSVGRTTIADILRQEGLDPGPKRGSGSWDEFLTRDAATLWACDFLSVKSATRTGFVDLYILAFIHLGTRRVIVSGPTATRTPSGSPSRPGTRPPRWPTGASRPATCCSTTTPRLRPRSTPCSRPTGPRSSGSGRPPRT